MSDRFGLVLGAGGVLGAAWTIGALRALEEVAGIDPRAADTIVGTSAGSVVAALLGCGIATEVMANHQQGIPVEGAPTLDDGGTGGPLPPRPRLRLGSRQLLWNTARHPRRATPLTLLSAVLPQGRGSLTALGEMVESVAPGDGWAPHPRTWVVAMDYQTGRRVAFGRPDAPAARLGEAVMASCAIPGWYAPVEVAGRRYVDGGTCSQTSLDLLTPLALDDVYVFSPMTSFAALDDPPSVAAKLERQVRRLLTRRLLREARRVRAGGTRVHLFGPGASDLAAIGANLMDPRRRQAVFETSLRTSAQAVRADARRLAPAGRHAG